ncbi:hypothetical protein OF846_003678 [Rhodotorula toruloides]|nr:hypothetical protein OF846_003678 [Rhodotorula toruloides]
MARGNQRDKVKRSFRSFPYPFAPHPRSPRPRGRFPSSFVRARKGSSSSSPFIRSGSSHTSSRFLQILPPLIARLTSSLPALQAQKKAADAQKGKRNDDGKSFKARQEADAAIMRQKQEAAAAKKAADGAKAK